MRLDAHGWSLALRPELGGAIAQLRHAGRDVLRPTPPDATDPLETACFPLVPYANRIAQGRFDFDGQGYRLPPNFGDHPHSLHGVGWQSAWQVVTHGIDHVVLRHEHGGGGGWPWAYRAEQRLTLARDAMRAELSLTNLSERTAPAGLGFHPYFPLDDSSRLRFTAARVWQVDATALPTVPAPADHFGDWTAGRAVADDGLIDNSFEGWDGSAIVEQANGGYRLEAHGASVLHLYRPPGLDFFCIEPTSHLPNAINSGSMPVLAPRATLTLQMFLRLGAIDDHLDVLPA